MERESFEDDEVAAALRSDFIAVKVDKEERPDVDAVYMQVTQALTGGGGWPMTVLLTPDKKAFFAGTYFPKYPRYGSNGLLDILSAAVRHWKTNRSNLEALSGKIQKALETRPAGGVIPAMPSIDAVKRAYDYLNAVFDENNGGFGNAPKFPSPHNLLFLLRYGVKEHEARALEMAEITLTQMYRGGLFDHVGSGFSRYSTDNLWLVPHFEKMLYDNALLVMAYTEAYQVTGKQLCRRVAEDTLGYVLRELTGGEGGFFCAQDADSEGHEGRYYVWSPEELVSLLGFADGNYWNNWYGITQKGNFEGQNIPNLLKNPGYADYNQRIYEIDQKVYSHRLTRVKLHKDDKSLTSWNSLMITAFAKAGVAFGKPEYIDIAKSAEAFIHDKLTGEDGQLRVSYRDGESKGNGYLDDYAFYTWALLTLYDAVYDASYLERALDYADMMCSFFEDTENGGFFIYSGDAEVLMTRPKETYDGAVPSGNSAAAYVLCRIAGLTGGTKWEERSRRQLSFMASACREHPASYCFSNLAVMDALYPPRQLICASALLGDVSKLRGVLSKYYLPELTTLVITPDNRERLIKLMPALKNYTPLDGETAFYLCENNTCAMPFTGFDTLERRLGKGIVQTV